MELQDAVQLPQSNDPVAESVSVVPGATPRFCVHYSDGGVSDPLPMKQLRGRARQMAEIQIQTLAGDNGASVSSSAAERTKRRARPASVADEDSKEAPSAKRMKKTSSIKRSNRKCKRSLLKPSDKRRKRKQEQKQREVVAIVEEKICLQ